MAAGKGKGGGKAKPKGTLTRRATNNVQLQDAGQANLLQQQLQQAQQDYLRSSNAAGSIYPGAQESIGDLQRPQFGQIQSDFDTALGTVKGMFGGDQAQPYMASGESDAGMGLGNAYGEAGATMLANAASREGMYRSSAQRDANLKQQNAQDTLLQQMQDTVQGYNNQLGQLRADDPWQIAQERNTLWDQAQQQKALQSKLESDQAFSDYLMGQYGSAASGGGGGGGYGGGGGGGGGGGNFPTTSNGRTDWRASHGYPPGGGGGGGGGAPSADQFGGRAQGGLGQPAGAWSGGPGARNVVQDVRQADTPSDLPGWVRYAYRRTGGTALHDMDRRRLYEDKLSPILRKHLGVGGDLYR